MIDQIKNIRQDLDKISEGLLQTFPNENAEMRMTTIRVDKAIDSVLLSKGWLGKLLQELGTENPYKSGYKIVEDIEPTADKAQFTTSEEFEKKSYIEKLDAFRQWIDARVHDIKKITNPDGVLPPEYNARDFAIARTNAYSYLCQARFWLGFELQRLKEESGIS